jgi:transposase
MRKGMDGLGMLAQQVLNEDPFGGALFAFRGRRGGLVKLLWNDGQGMCLFSKRLELTPSELRREASRTKDADASRRMLAIALLLEGHSREQAAHHSGMDRQTLRGVHRYNAEGIGGLFDRPHGGGAPRKLTAAEETEIVGWVHSGPDPETDGVVRWRLSDLRQKIAQTFAVHLHERSVGKLMRRLGFRRLSVRPRHPQADASAQEAHKTYGPPRPQAVLAI